MKNGDLFLLGHCDICMTGAEAGFPILFEAFLLEEELMQRFFKSTTDGLMPILEAQLEMGVDGILGANDWCYKSGPMISPKLFSDLMVPQLKHISGMAHEYGRPYIKHLDGNVMPILDILIEEVGIDAYHSIEPTAGMDIFSLKWQYGDKSSLWGNVDSGELLVNGTPGEIRDYCMRLLKECAPGGGYVMATSNAVHDAIPMGNIMAMIDTCNNYERRQQ